jgi:hypothetical protein
VQPLTLAFAAGARLVATTRMIDATISPMIRRHDTPLQATNVAPDGIDPCRSRPVQGSFTNPL